MSLKITVDSEKSFHTDSEVLTILVPQFSSSDSKEPPPPSFLNALNKSLSGAPFSAIKYEEFVGKKEQFFCFQNYSKALPARCIALAGVGAASGGEEELMSQAEMRSLGAKLARFAQKQKAKTLTVYLPECCFKHLRVMAEGLVLGAYRFTKYFTGERLPKSALEEVHLISFGSFPQDAREHIKRGVLVADAVNLARDLSNEAPNELYPEALAEVASRVARSSGLTCTTFDYKEIKKRKMGLLQAVGQGSDRKPVLVHLAYIPKAQKTSKRSAVDKAEKARRKRYVFIGKGVTFDTGGISIKPSAGMQEMKHDMSGAANIVGLMKAVAALQPDIEVHGIIAAAENMPDGGAYRPGDVWTSYDGKTVEITNTDAEGRLILADALTYAVSLHPDFIVDNATLTGACVVALGATCSGWYANSEGAAKEFQKAVDGSGEQMWRMPLLAELKDQLKSDVADLKNAGDRMGGSISAALFLQEFIGKTPKWVHADIAGPAMPDKPFRWDPKGGTGHGVLTFLAMIENHK